MSFKNFEETANKIIENVGGKENITFATYCVTRLRINVKDKNLVKLEKLAQIDGVVGSRWSGDQLQIIVSQAVSDLYEILLKKTGLSKQEQINENLDSKKKINIAAALDNFSASITPIIPVLIAAGLIKIIVLVGEMIGFLLPESPTHTILTFVGDAGFYFLPIYIGNFAARKFGANPALGMFLGAILVHPTFISLINEHKSMSIFGLPIYNASYQSSIFPIIITVFVLSKVEKFFAKLSPDSVRSIIEPFFTIIIMLPLMLCLLAPAGAFIGTYVTQIIMWLYSKIGFLGVGMLAMLLPLLVMTGMHSALTPYLLQAFATLGYDPLVITANVVTNLNQGAAAAAVSVKTKEKNLKAVATSSAITAIVAGVTEPALFGINLKLKKPLIAVMIGSFIGGAVAGFGRAYAYAFVGSGGIFAFPAFISKDISGLIWMALGCGIGMIATFILTLVLYKEEPDNN